jgi:putative ABC transport system permease protein
MLDLDKAIKKWRKELRKNEAMEDGYVEELESHLRDEIDRLCGEGLDRKEAFEKAVEGIGKVENIGTEYHKTNTRRLSGKPPWQTRLGMSGLMASYFRVAFRKIKRQKGYSFINILGLTIGLSCFILIGLWVKEELSYDRFHQKKDRIYRLMNRLPNGSSTASVTYALGPALKAAYPEVEESCRVWPWGGSLVKYLDKSFEENNICLVDPSFFKVFTFPLIKGTPESALSDKYSVVLTEETAYRYFGDEDPIGKVLHMTQYEGDFKVTGVIENIPMNSHLRFDMVVRVDLLGEDRLARWAEWLAPSYILLHPGVSAANFEKQIEDIYKKNIGPETTYVPVLQKLTRVHLYQFGRPGRIKRVYAFSIIALFILLMACINFMNLATAQSSKRSQEVGIRKVIGAMRLQVARQFLGEALLTAFIALLLALIVVESLLPYFNQFTGKSMLLFSGANSAVILTLLLVTLGTGLIAGSYPAVFLSSFQPAQTLKTRSTVGRSGGSIRKILIIVQFAISVGLITCTLVVSKQLRLIQNQDLGLNREHVVIIRNNPILRPRFDAFKDILLSHPEIRDVTAAAQIPTQVGQSIQIDWEGNPTQAMLSIDYTVVDYDFFKTFDMKILKGRSFSREFATDEKTACIINETAARQMELEDPIGTTIYMNHPAWDESLRFAQVIGVVNDFNARSLHTGIRPFVFRMYKPWCQYAFVKIEGSEMQKTLAYIKSAFEKYAPGHPFSFEFLDDAFNRQYSSERQLGSLFNWFSIVSIFISCLGLFGLASFITEQKTKEIGIRKVFGATVPGIVRLTAREFIKWVAVANFIAWPIAYVVMRFWLQEFAYRVSIGPMIFGLAATLTLFITLATVSYHSLRAAHTNPVDSLRYE